MHITFVDRQWKCEIKGCYDMEHKEIERLFKLIFGYFEFIQGENHKLDKAFS